jgi:hypothetical protein
MVSKDDIHCVLAYYHLQAKRKYCPHEIAYRPSLRAGFLRLARQILGEVSAKEIILRLITLKNACPSE